MTFKELAKDNSFMQLWFENQTGYGMSKDRSGLEIKRAQREFEEFCKTQILSEAFVKDYECHFVRERQLDKISHEECDLKIEKLKKFGKKYAADYSRTFFEWLTEFETGNWESLPETEPVVEPAREEEKDEIKKEFNELMDLPKEELVERYMKLKEGK